MKSLFTFTFLLITNYVLSQVGILTKTPNATLDIRSIPSNLENIDGVIAPKLTGIQLKSKDNLYSQNQIGTIIYITEPLDNTNSTTTLEDDVTIKTKNVIKIGYYYFDGNHWIGFSKEQPITFFKSNEEQHTASVLNNNPGTHLIATFKDTDSQINQATIFNSSTSYFKILYDGLYEFSGTICFNPGRFYAHESEGHGDLTIEERIIININIQYSTDNGSSWNGITGMRTIYNKSNADLNVPISTPIAMKKLLEGTLIRLTLNRPTISPNEQVAGTNRTNQLPTSYNNINIPSGLDYTKLIKIQKLQ